MMSVLTADKEDSLFRGYIPLDDALLKTLDGSDKITEISFSGNGYATDALLHLIKRRVKQPANKFSTLKTIDLTGCNLITDHGLRTLIETFNTSVLKGVTSIELRGCSKLTDNTLAFLLDTFKLLDTRPICSMMCSSVSYLGLSSADISTAGCQSDIFQGRKVDNYDCQALVVPHSSMSNSLATFLKHGNIVDRKSAVLESGLKVGDWNFTVTELSSSTCLFESATNSELTQVIIPFESSADPKSVKEHVMSTVSRVVAKEAKHHPYQAKLESFNVGSMGDRPFLDIHLLDRTELFMREDGRPVLRNVSTSETSIGVYISSAKFSRTNNYFEVEIGKVEKEGEDQLKFAVLIGCLYDQLHSSSNPMDSTSDTGGFVDGLQVKKVGQKFGFGIEGEWLSEYVPSPSAQFYFIQDGIKSYGKDRESNLKDTPSTGMHPLVSVLGETIGEVILPKMVTPPKEVEDRMKKEKRWIERKFTSHLDSVMVDKEGRMRMITNSSYGNLGVFLGRYEMTAENHSFSIVIEKLNVAFGKSGSEFYFGVASELFKESVKPSSCVFLHVRLNEYRASWICSECQNQNNGSVKTCVICGKGTIPEEATNPRNWSCNHCKHTNDVKDVVCSSCKKGMIPEGFGQYAREVWSEINMQASSKIIEQTDQIQEGDTFTVTVSKATGNDLTQVEFFHNGKQICVKKFPFKPSKASRLVPCIRLKYPNDVLRLKNYKPTYRRPAPMRNKITVGRNHFLKVMDNGEMEDSGDTPKTGPKLYSIFVSKVPFNKDLLEFEVQILQEDSTRLFGIGGSGFDFDASKFIGWIAGSVGYHGDNGQIYNNSGSGISTHKQTSNDTKLYEGDLALMKVLPLNAETPLQFDEDDDLASQQSVKLQFFKNGELMHELVYEILTESFYPVICLKGAKVKVSNFYAETEDIWRTVESRGAQRSKEKTDINIAKSEETKTETYSGTEFLVVGVGKEGSDPSGKLQILQQQIHLDDWPELHNVTRCISEMEKNLGGLDFQEQYTYGQLCAVEDNMKTLQKYSSRISFHSITLDGNEKLKEALLKKMSSIQDKHKKYQLLKYRKSAEAVKNIEDILTAVREHKMIGLSKLTSTLPNVPGQHLLPLLKVMHSEGKVLLFDMGQETVACDIDFMFKVEDQLLQLVPTEMIDTKSMVTCIGQNSHVWTSNGLKTKVFGDTFSEEQMNFLKYVMAKTFGVIPLQCLRSSVEDEQTVYVINQNLSTSPASFNDYLPLSDKKDFVVMKQTYTIPAGFPPCILSLVISNTSKYGRPVLITEKGVVYQNGCVQTIILKDIDEKGLAVLVIESRCYMPSLQEDRNMSKQTSSYVQDFTWNIFCIYTDIIDDLLRRSNVVAKATKDVPAGLVNVSVGCKHKWIAMETKTVNQSVCTLCNKCVNKGDKCVWNALVAEYLRDCECGTDLTGCKYCGICVGCATELWGIRTRLRPYSLMMTKVQETLVEKTKLKTQKDDVDNTSENFSVASVPNIAMDPFMYNEVEFTNLTIHEKIVCLKKKSDGTVLQAYPGKAHYIADLKKVDIKKAVANVFNYKLNVGDRILLRLSDESGTSYRLQDKSTAEVGELELEPQYFAYAGREVRVIHETGVLVYETASSAIPVGQFISCRALTKECPEFSVRILSTGKGGYIAVGLVPQNYPPNRQPGWNAQGIGYHADDGGIFLESGSPTRRTLKATVGDEMSFHCDFARNKGFFRKNGEKCIELNLNPSRLGYYPCVGFHSLGESVQLLQKNVWTPRNETERNMDTPAFTTYKYGNLWISPGKIVTFTKVGSEYCGWVILHNPLKEQVGFKVTGSTKAEDTCFGVIEDKKNWVHHFRLKREQVVEAVTVEWMSLETGRTYTKDDMVTLFGESQGYHQQAGFQHRIKVKIVESQNVVEELPTVSATTDQQIIQSCLRLSVYRNETFVEDYYLKQGAYQVSVETNNKEANFILRYPKCPSFLYPRTYQKGMKLIAHLDSMDIFAECVVVDLYSGGKMLALEYSPKDKDVNSTVCIKADSPILNFSSDVFKGNDSTVIPYESRNTPTSLTKTFVNAPPYLLSQAAQEVMQFIDKDWKANVLKKFNLCAQVFTRPTVQEKSMCNAVRSLMDWLKDDEDMYLYTFLPSELSVDHLVYPNLTSMFKDVAVHRPCFSYNEMKLIQDLAGFPNNRMWKIPIHFVDIPGIVPDTPLPIEALYGDWKTVWTYMALIGQKLNLTSYNNLIKGDSSGLSQNQVEKLFYNMLQSYTSLCGIYNAAWGGVQYTPTNEDRHEIKDAIKNRDQYIRKFPGKPQTDADALFKFTSYDKYAVCKAHCLNNDVTDVMLAEKDITFSYDYFEPYLKSVSVFNWSLTTLKELPEDFFEKFENLQYFSIGSLVVGNHMGRLTSLPGGFHKAKSLQVVKVQNTAITELPKDIFMSPTVVLMELNNMPIKKLPEDFVENSDMKTLSLNGLLLDTVPENLGRLHALTYLSLNQNPVTSLPETLQNLKNLKTLDLTGAHWFTRETCKNMHHLVHDAYLEWHAQYPVCKNYLGEEVIEKLFEEFDINYNGSLDEEELAALNLKLFFDFPRIGIKDINDDVTGGIPAVVFHLQSLNRLTLDYNAITMVPQAINNLQNLEYLSLNHNPLLESLPGSLGHLPNIRKIDIKSCPMLRTPPNEVVSRGFDSVKAYLKKLAGGFTECRRTKLMVVGLGGAGKTSLLRALMSENKITSGTEKEIPTDGIDIIPWTVKSKDNREVTYSTWDFAGQAVYYNTHQFFLSKRAVYLLLWSMRQGYEHAGLDFWLSSISCHAPGTPIIVIGTQCDLIPQAEIPEKELRERYPQIASFHQVSSVTGIGIAKLQEDLLDITLQQGYMGEKIPQVWLNFEKRILAERITKVSYIKWDMAKRYAMEQGIYDEKDVRMAVQLLHDLGTVQYFDNDFLRDYVVINPQWIVNVMACVVSAQDSPIQKNSGRFLHSDIPVVWKDYDPDLHRWLLRLTEDFDLTFPLPKEPVNIVPCLLPTEEPEDLKWPSVREKKGERETKMVYKFTYLPSGLFNRAQVRLFQFSDGKQVWKKGSLLSKNKHLALIKQSDNTELVVFVQGPRPENILFLIHEVFESIIEESFNGVSYDLLVPCPDCITKEGTFDPCLLNAELIQRAKDRKAPFLQCYKHFHWISMAHLEEKLPTTSRDVADFDIQLQQSIVALEELNSDLIRDTAIIYSSANVPNPNDKDAVPPSLIRDDIVKWGYSCWFADNMETVSSVDLTTAFKHCKVLIALVSDEFERDTKCRDMFLYAKETMNKEIITVVLGESMEWMNKDLGMKLGNQERKIMAKTMHRYTVEGGRREELQKWLEEKILQSRKDEDTPPEIFLSYCWSNSHDAQEKSGKHLPAALGWADPRTLKSQLQENGLNCWIDIEYVGREKKGIFRDMANGIRNSKVMLACISDEYADSDNCMMELRFGILNLELPVVAAIVGQGNEWKETEVAMLLRRSKAPEVHLQRENPEGCNTLVKYIKDTIVNMELTKNSKPKRKDNKAKLLQEVKEGKKEEQSSSIAYQEEYELIQRKFMRHIIGAISTKDLNPLPRLILVDFIKSASGGPGEDGRESNLKKSVPKSRKMLRPKSASRSRDRLQVDESVFDDDVEDWSRESFCVRVLCEHEEGWHLCDEKYPLAFRNHEQLETYLKTVAPYLYRIYSILKQSPIKLNCFTGGKNGKGEAYQAWIRSESESNLDFIGAMMHLRSELSVDEASEFVSCLSRCRLPSGKIVWLCCKHQNLTHVAKLSTGSTGGSHNVQKVLFSEDKLLMENMEKSELYKQLKSVKSNQVTSSLPAPVPIPQFAPKIMPAPEVKEKISKTSPPPPPQKEVPPPPPPQAPSTQKTPEQQSEPMEKMPLERKASKQNVQANEAPAPLDKRPVEAPAPLDKRPIEGKSEEKTKFDEKKEKESVKKTSEKVRGLPETVMEEKTEEQPDKAPLPRHLPKTYSRTDVQEQIRKMVLESANETSMLKKNKPVLSKTKSNANVYSSNTTARTEKKQSKSESKNGFDHLQQQAIKSQKKINHPKLSTSTSDPKPSHSRIVRGSTVRKDVPAKEDITSPTSQGDLHLNLRVKSTESDSSQSKVSTKSDLGKVSIDKKPARQIKVKEYNGRPAVQKGVGLKATGTTIGQAKNGEMPLPEGPTSKACILQ